MFISGSIGLIKSKLAIELSNNLVFEDSATLPSGIIWKDQLFPLNHKVVHFLGYLLIGLVSWTWKFLCFENIV